MFRLICFLYEENTLYIFYKNYNGMAFKSPLYVDFYIENMTNANSRRPTHQLYRKYIILV